MADAQEQTIQNTAPTTGGGEPAGQAQVMPQVGEDIDALRQRLAEAEKFKPLAEAVARFGISDPDDLESALRPVAAARQRGLDLDQLLGALDTGRRPDPNAGRAGDAPLTMESVRSMIDERFERQRHDSLMSEQDRLVSALASELGGSNDVHKTVIDKIVKQMIVESAQLYPIGHPLRDLTLAPVVGDQFKAISEKVRELWRTFVGSELKALGQAGQAAPTAGQNQAASGETYAPQGPIPFDRRDRGEKEAVARQIMQSIMPARPTISGAA